MKPRDPHCYDGFEKKPEAEWTEEDRYNASLGFVPLTEAGHKAWREEQRKKNPAFDEVMRFCEEWGAQKTWAEKMKVLEKYGMKVREERLAREAAQAQQGRTETPRQDEDGEVGEK